MGQSTRQAFGECLARLGETHPEIVVLDADLSKSTKSEIFAKKFPERFYEMGIAEANMIGVAAGLALAGKLPFACSFGCFLTGRFDTIRMSIAYSRANVRLVGTHAGVGIGDDGYSQMGLEDVALMRALPLMGVFQPMDAFETEQILCYLTESWVGPAYLRLTRQNVPDLFPQGLAFQPQKIHLIHEPAQSAGAASRGKRRRIACLATGATVSEAVQASRDLQLLGVDLAVWSVHCLKPFDEAGLQALLPQVTGVVTVEDHSVVGGLGSVVAEVLASHAPEHTQGFFQLRLGIQDCFGESGEQPGLYEQFGISAGQIRTRLLKRLQEGREA